MPQLDPAPWFFILSVSWMILLLFSPMKITKFQHLNDPTSNCNKSLSSPWLWPWS